MEREIEPELKRWFARETPNAERLLALQAGLRNSWQPVRPLPGAAAMTAIIVVVAVACSAVVAVVSGPDAVRQMAREQMALYLFVLLLGILAAAVASVQQIIPGARVRFSPWLTGVVLCALPGALVLFLFPPGATTLQAGHSCFLSGCLTAAFTGAALAIVLRREMAAATMRTGAVIGLVAGFAGMLLLALHCTVFTAAHVLVWHVPVIFAASGVGAGLTSLPALRSRSRA